ncbi:type II toxin-antitoxin system RelE family toxin [Yinghuangia aomiensis]
MNYRLYLDRTQHDSYRSLPDPVRMRLAAMLVDALIDPYAVTRPYGIGDDGDDTVMRIMTAPDLVVVLMVTATKTVTVLSISHLSV